MKKIVTDWMIILSVLFFSYRNVQLFRADLHYQRGEKQTGSEMFAEALIEYDRARQILPARAQYQRAVGRTCAKLYKDNDNEKNLRLLYKAYHAYDRVMISDPFYPYGWFEMGSVLLDLQSAGVRDMPSAGPYFERAVELDPTNPRFLSGWISWNIQKGRKELAWEAFLRLAVSYPGGIKWFDDELLLTDQDLLRFGREIGDSPRAGPGYVRYLIGIKRYDLAYEQFLRIPESDRSQVQVVLLEADILFGQGQKDRAKRILTEKLNESADNITIINSLCRILADEKDFAGAIAIYQKALLADPGKWEYNLDIARLALQDKDNDLAGKHYTQALASGKADKLLKKEIYCALAEIKRKRGDLKGAMADFKKALNVAPKDTQIIYSIKRLDVEIEFRNRASKDK